MFKTFNVLNATGNYLIKECFYQSFLFQLCKSAYFNLWPYASKLKELKVHIQHVIFREVRNKNATEIVKKICSVYDQGAITDCQVQNCFSTEFYLRRIKKLPDKWQEVIQNNRE